MVNIVELVEMALRVSTVGLIDLLIDIRVGVAWWLLGVDNLVASRPPLEVGATSLETASTWVVGMRSP
jgi:hypothetical protein